MPRRSDTPPVPARIKWLAFLGWLVLPVLAAWATTAMLGSGLLWSGPIWTGYAVVYMAGYFAWVRRRGVSAKSCRSARESASGPRRG